MLQLNHGDALRMNCRFEHRGAAFTGAKIRGAIGNDRPIYLGGFDEILFNVITVSGIKSDTDWTLYTVTVDILITTAIEEGRSYEAYAKLMGIPGADIFWYGPADDIFIGVPVGPAEFQNLVVTYAKA